ncbi:hypothetical protein AMTRI_Chr12g271990 [Amborella trichopoda]
MPKIVVSLSRWCSLSLSKVVDCRLSLSTISALVLSPLFLVALYLSAISALVSLSCLSRGKKMHFELCILKCVGLCVYLRRTFPISRG